MDLGDIFSGIYDTVDAGLGGWLPGGVPPQLLGGVPGIITNNQPAPTPPPPVQNLPVPQSPGGVVPMPTQNVPAPAGHCGASPVFKRVNGEYRWVFPKRRRRRALVTQTDLKGLAALKGVLGQGKAFETWIATHS